MTAEKTWPTRLLLQQAAAHLRAPVFAAVIFGGATSFAQPSVQAGPAIVQTSTPVVVEMFLSQSCKTCPPAADYLTELADRENLVALAWHVDYWNLFANRNTGRWQDPFSRASYAERQRRYNLNIRGRSTVFTPQAVIDGVLSSVGYKREEVENNIQQAQFMDEKAAAQPPSIEMVETFDNDVSVKITGVSTTYDVLLVSFYQHAVTDVEGGDNAGVKFAEAHVVDELETLVSQSAGPSQFSVPLPSGNMGCAILVQEPDQGRVIAAQYCPTARPVSP